MANPGKLFALKENKEEDSKKKSEDEGQEYENISELANHVAFRHASDCQGQPHVFEMNLSRIKNNILIETPEDKEKKETLQNEIENLQIETEKLINNQETYKKERIPEKEKEIDEFKKRIQKIKDGDYQNTEVETKPVDKFTYWFSWVIFVVLGIYLIIFYSSVIYNAFFLKPMEAAAKFASDNFTLPTIMNLNAYPSIWQSKGILGVAGLFSASFIFIALGFLIHKFNENKERFKMASLLTFTLVFDCILAYHVVHNLHEANFATGQVKKEWVFNMAFNDVKFYIIIFAGFAIYLIWGFVLEEIIKMRENLNPAWQMINEKKLMIKEKEKEIQNLKEELNEIQNKITENQKRIQGKENELQKIVYDPKEIEQKIIAYSQGWINWISGAYPDKDSKAQSQEIDRLKNEFLKNHVHLQENLKEN